MPYLFVLNGRERCRAFYLKKDVTIIGQRDDADVVLKDPWISWSHARVVKEGSAFVVEDLGSTNGTYVDCAKVARRALADDDVVFLGRTHILYVASNRLPSAPPPQPRDEAPVAERWGVTDRLDAAFSKDGIYEFRGPLEDAGRIAELDAVAHEPDTDGFLPPPPEDPDAAAGGGVEIDVADLLDSDGKALAPAVDPEGETDAEMPDLGGFPFEADMEPLDDPTAEIARLRAALAAREAEVRRLREEVRRLKEQYLDL